MADYGLYKNSEGYSDPTAAEAIKGMAKPGEIWTYKGKEVLIVKNRGGYSSILIMTNKPGKGKDSMEVAGLYTVPGMVNYVFNNLLGKCVDRLSDADFNEVLNEVEAAFDFGGKLSKPATIPVEFAVNADLEAENAALKKEIATISALYDKLVDKMIDKIGNL